MSNKLQNDMKEKKNNLDQEKVLVSTEKNHPYHIIQIYSGIKLVFEKLCIQLFLIQTMIF